MAEHDQQPAIVLRPGHSRALAVFIVSIHLSAILALWATPTWLLAKTGVTFLVLTSLGVTWSLHVDPLLHWAVTEACWNSDDSWRLRFADGSERAAELLPSSYVSLRLVVLSFRCGTWCRSALVLPWDRVDSETLRRLRVRLRLSRMTHERKSRGV